MFLALKTVLPEAFLFISEIRLRDCNDRNIV